MVIKRESKKERGKKVLSYSCHYFMLTFILQSFSNPQDMNLVLILRTFES